MNSQVSLLKSQISNFVREMEHCVPPEDLFERTNELKENIQVCNWGVDPAKNIKIIEKKLNQIQKQKKNQLNPKLFSEDDDLQTHNLLSNNFMQEEIVPLTKGKSEMNKKETLLAKYLDNKCKKMTKSKSHVRSKSGIGVRRQPQAESTSNLLPRTPRKPMATSREQGKPQDLKKKQVVGNKSVSRKKWGEVKRKSSATGR